MPAAVAVAALSPLLAASELGYAALRTAGAGCLACLGVQAPAGFVRPRRSGAADTLTTGHGTRRTRPVPAGPDR